MHSPLREGRGSGSFAPWRWVALLGFALIAPVTLPAGGADRRLPEVRRRQAGEPLLSAGARSLQASPERQAPALARRGWLAA
jgi:hypothetical protein